MGKEKKTKEKNKKKKSKVRTAIKTFFLLLLITFIIFLAIFLVNVYRNGGGIKGFLATFLGNDITVSKELPEIYCLIIGQSQNMTDTLMVMKYDPQKQEASVMSVPRDSYIGKDKKKATAFDKINARYQINPQSTIDAVNQLTGLNIKYYITVDTKALIKLVDANGGIHFDVPIDMDYDDTTQDLAIHVKKGYQLLNGEQAEGVVRFRHNNDFTSYPTEYGDNDVGRMRTQREFITQVAKQVLKPGNIFKINDFMVIAQENIVTNMDWGTIKNYIPFLVEFNTESLKTGSLPATPEYINNISFMFVNEKEAQKVVKELFITTPSETGNTNINETGNTIANTTNSNTTGTKQNGEKIKVEILNGSGIKTNLDKAEEQLERYGYKVIKKGNTTNTSKTVIINRTNISQDKENAIKSILGAGSLSNGENNKQVDITIILGKDY